MEKDVRFTDDDTLVFMDKRQKLIMIDVSEIFFIGTHPIDNGSLPYCIICGDYDDKINAVINIKPIDITEKVYHEIISLLSDRAKNNNLI